MHKQARNYVERLKAKFPEYFKGKKVLEVGSLNINGSVRDLFEDCEYVGVDMVDGEGVDIVTTCIDHFEFDPGWFTRNDYDIIFSTEALEHDENWEHTLSLMYVNAEDFIFFTCATTGRDEHGTTEHKPHDSPATNHYYRNLTQEDIIRWSESDGCTMDEMFSSYEFEVNEESHDLYFWGIVK